MKALKLKYIPLYLALVVVIFAWDRVFDWLSAILEHSPIFNGIMVFTGVATLPLWLLLIAQPDQRPFPPDARYPRPLVALQLFSASASLIFYGLRYWFPGLGPASVALFGVFLVSSVINIFLILRADKKQAAKRRAHEASQAGKPDGA